MINILKISFSKEFLMKKYEYFKFMGFSHNLSYFSYFYSISFVFLTFSGF